MYLYFENNGDRQWEIDIKLDVHDNLKVAKYHKKDEKNLSIIVPPGIREVAVLKKIDPPARTNLSWTYTQKWRG